MGPAYPTDGELGRGLLLRLAVGPEQNPRPGRIERIRCLGLRESSTLVAAGDRGAMLCLVASQICAASALYDAIGLKYSGQRRTDPRIAARIWQALGDAKTVLNVGAGTGSYELPDREVTAVEPSAVMRAQRPQGAAPCVAARAEALPFADGCFDAAMAVLSDHHWHVVTDHDGYCTRRGSRRPRPCLWRRADSSPGSARHLLSLGRATLV